MSNNTAASALAGADPQQKRLMSEEVILVDAQDKVMGSMSKVNSHLLSNDLPLHRAFSLFLFDTQGRMLIQKRAATKVTFPSHWTNTVCSHPLYNATELGLGECPAIDATGNAVVRKLAHELGSTDLSTRELLFLTRIHYRAEEQVWGEHELDYVYFAQKDCAGVVPQPNEVEAVRYVTQQDLKELYKEAGKGAVKMTPWFTHIIENLGWRWWDALLKGGLSQVDKFTDKETIHRMKT